MLTPPIFVSKSSIERDVRRIGNPEQSGQDDEDGAEKFSLILKKYGRRGL